MAHNLDITNGVASFVSAREDAWHKLGQVLPDTFTASAALEHGMLAEWNLRKQPLLAQLEDGSTIPVADRFAVVRDNPVTGLGESLGVVGSAYKIVQNEQLTGVLDTLVDESGAHFETAGAIDGGRKVFVTMKLPGHIKVGGVDPVESYLAAMTSHDGTTSTVLMVTPVRIVCQNTLNMAYKESSHQFRVRHTSGADSALIQQAREALDFSFDYLEGFQEEANQLINTELTQSRFRELIEKEFGAPRDAHKVTVSRTENKLDQMEYLFTDSDTHEGMRNTAWAGMNALTEWYDHYSPVRANGGDEAAARSRKALLEPEFKEKARRIMMALV